MLTIDSVSTDGGFHISGRIWNETGKHTVADVEWPNVSEMMKTVNRCKKMGRVVYDRTDLTVRRF
jgi:hypothetical protein